MSETYEQWLSGRTKSRIEQEKFIFHEAQMVLAKHQRFEESKKHLELKVRKFYDLFNSKCFAECYKFLDPELNVNFETYNNQLSEFLEREGVIEIVNFTNRLFMEDSSYVIVTWVNSKGEARVFQERWVYKKNSWYTRIVGYI